MKTKRILTDADGVLLNWTEAFVAWAYERGYTLKEDHEHHYRVESKLHGVSTDQGNVLVDDFNASSALRSLKPFRDAQTYVPMIAGLGFEFHCITSIDNHPDIVDNRTHNLRELFGDIFHEVTCVPDHENKTKYLSEYKDSECIWVEDHVKNAINGHDLGLRSIIMSHDANLHLDHDGIHRVHTWKEIYESINRHRV